MMKFIRPKVHNSQTVLLKKILIIVILGAVFTGWCVDSSFDKGRLSSVPNYDDVRYFLSGTRVLESLEHSNPPITDQLVYKNFHSPYSTLMATVAFAVLGFHDYAPYIFNYFVILLYLFIIGYLFRDVSLSMWTLWLVSFLTLPFATMVVVEFRPDLCWAILIGFSALFGISCRNYFKDWRQPAIHSMLFALSLLVKPSMFAMAIILFALSAGYRTAIQWLDTRSVSWRILAQTSLIYAVVTLLIAGPYFSFFGVQTWNYFWANLFGENKAIWAYNAGWLEQFSYYISGPSLANNLGNIWWAIGGCWIAGSIAAILRRDRQAIQLVGGLWTVAIVTYLLSSFAKMKSPFLGGAFYSTAILGAACFLNDFFKSPLPIKRPSTFKRIALSLFIAVLCIFLYQWPPYSGSMDSPIGRNNKYMDECVDNEIAKLSLPQNPLIVFTHTGPVKMDNVAMWFLRQGLPVRVQSMSYRKDTKGFKKSISRAALVFLQDPGMKGANLGVPSELFQEQFKSIINATSQFILLEKIESIDGKFVYLYLNKCFQGYDPLQSLTARK